MSIDKQILQALGLDKTSITIGIDEDLQIELEYKIDNYLKEYRYLYCLDLSKEYGRPVQNYKKS